MSAKYPTQPLVKLKSPEWSKNACIYQVNTRQYSQKGDFKSLTKDLERIVELGCTIVWLMPIHEIGVKNRKGSLGSPYAVKDYFSINPEFGTATDFKALVARAHSLGLKVILDWVPNHSAWDNLLVEQHPDWYAKDYKGDFRPSPWWDWDDIIEFDYSNTELREYMINALIYWVKEFDIDGYRCDVAGYVPNDFWKQARQALDKVKPVFMLAEWENRDLHEYAFDMTYAWSWNETLYAIVKGEAHLDKLRKYFSWNERSWPKEAYRMTFISNHDENAWEGTPDEKFGEAQKACIVLSCLGEGMPLIHNGQEAGESKRLAFFERDPIEWKKHEIGDFYHFLLGIRKAHSALWNGAYGATMIQVPNNNQASIFSFVRQNEQSKWFIVLNFSSTANDVYFDESLFVGDYTDVFTGKSVTFEEQTALSVDAWGYRVFKSTP